MLLAVAPTVFILEGGYHVEERVDRQHGQLRDGLPSIIESLLAVAATVGGKVLPPAAMPEEGVMKSEMKPNKSSIRYCLNGSALCHKLARQNACLVYLVEDASTPSHSYHALSLAYMHVSPSWQQITLASNALSYSTDDKEHPYCWRLGAS